MLDRPRGRRLLCAAAGLSVLALLGTACSSSGSTSTPQAAQSGPVTIHLVENAPSALWQPMLNDFNASHPDIKVVASSIPFDNEATIVQARLSQKDSSFDVFVVDQPRTADWASHGYLVNLTGAVASQAKATLFPAALQASEYQGSIWDVPVWESSNQLFYNAALLKKAGVTPPSVNPAQRWTWQQTVAAAKQVQAKTGAPCGLLLEQTDRYYQLEPMIISAGGGTGLTGPGNLTPDIQNAGWVKAATFYQDLFKDNVTPSSVNASETDAYFDSGKCAFYVGLPDVVPGLVSNKVPFGIAPEPYWAGGTPATPNEANALGINPFSTHQAAALTFVKWAALTTAGDLASVQGIDIPPANVAASKIFFSQLAKSVPAMKDFGSLVNYELAHTAVARPVTVQYVEFEADMFQLFGNIRNGTPVASALAATSRQLKSAFQSAGQ
jgi:multiple sugar transport system substrate-binding protein